MPSTSKTAYVQLQPKYGNLEERLIDTKDSFMNQ